MGMLGPVNVDRDVRAYGTHRQSFDQHRLGEHHGLHVVCVRCHGIAYPRSAIGLEGCKPTCSTRAKRDSEYVGLPRAGCTDYSVPVRESPAFNVRHYLRLGPVMACLRERRLRSRLRGLRDGFRVLPYPTLLGISRQRLDQR